MTTTSPAADLLATLAEPTRLRILNCIAAAPLFIGELTQILHLPEAVVAEHVRVLCECDAVRDVPLEPHVLYTLAPLPGPGDRLLRTLLDLVQGDAALQSERAAATRRSRAAVRLRVQGAGVDAS